MAKCVFVFLIIALLALSVTDRQQNHSQIGNAHARHSQNLNNPWHYIVDPYENGIGARYYEDRRTATETALVEYDFGSSPTLQVPGDWNYQRDTLFFYEGPVWYEKRFAYEKHGDKRVFLYFGAANYRARVYLNGKKIGEHEGGFTPFDFEVTDTKFNPAKTAWSSTWATPADLPLSRR
jgi:beta-glucuronidase